MGSAWVFMLPTTIHEHTCKANLKLHIIPNCVCQSVNGWLDGWMKGQMLLAHANL